MGGQGSICWSVLYCSTAPSQSPFLSSSLALFRISDTDAKGVPHFRIGDRYHPVTSPLDAGAGEVGGAPANLPIEEVVLDATVASGSVSATCLVVTPGAPTV